LTVRPGGRTQSLLAALALGPRPTGIARDDLVEMLWPRGEIALSLQALRTLVYSLHRSLGDALGGQGPVIHVDGRYRLNADAGVVVDVDRFDSVVDAAEHLARTGAGDVAISRYRDAVQLYEGDLMIGSDIQHLLERERLRTRYMGARARLAEYHLARGEHAESLANALAILTHDPFREDAHRLAMRCYVRLGQRAQALRQFRLCRDLLAAEFEAAPERATEELYELVRLDPDRL
jgi:DNA-binding SARP family transcriptional activator